MTKILPTACISVMLLMTSGCASFIANNSGRAPSGVATGERTFAQMVTDNGITRTAQINLYKLDPRFQFARVNTNSFFSAVLLTGQVADPYLKQLAEDNAKSLPDVKIVHNYITIGDKLSFNQIVQDGLITTSVRANLLTVRQVKDTRLSITTENAIVYVMGQITQAESDAVLDVLQRTPNILKIVMLVDILPTTPALISPQGLATERTSLWATPAVIAPNAYTSLDHAAVTRPAPLPPLPDLPPLTSNDIAAPVDERKATAIPPQRTDTEAQLDIADGSTMPFMPEIKPLIVPLVKKSP